EHRRLLDSMPCTDYPAQQSDFIKRKQKGTGQWFLDANKVARWLSEAKATLFCPGIPGAGKTMIAAIAIDYLLKSTQNSFCGVTYVYCNYKAQEEQDATSMLAAILRQLVQARPSIVEPVERLYRQHTDRGTKPSLDECQDAARHRFLTKLQDLQAVRDIRLMVTSRFIPEIEDKFRAALRLEVQASEDVKRFVAGQMYRLPKYIQRDVALQQMVQEKIAGAVDTMFLLARLHTDSLLDKRTAKDVTLTLAGLSKGSVTLDHAYKHAIQRIEGQLSGGFELAKKIISWTTYAKRPITTDEISCTIAVEPEKAELDQENKHDVEDLVSVCAGLVVVDQESTVIRLVHYTTQEYCERIRDTWNPYAQKDIATTCLTYLSFDVFKSGSCSSDKEFEYRLQQNRFLHYAATYWGEHVETVEGEMRRLACSFLSAQFGLSNVSKAIMQSQVREIAATEERRDESGQTLLYLAAKSGHNRMVELLPSKDANVNAQGGKYGNALQAPSAGGHEQVKVSCMLSLGAPFLWKDGPLKVTLEERYVI
ncbi:uncharacterized protein BDR25DRAFT_247717, partial [Lindgomyces ingoldianus]